LIFNKKKLNLNRVLFSRLDHPYFDEIEAFEPDEALLKPVEPRVTINIIQYTNRNGFVLVSKTN
jgi:hypothetical protein